MGQEDKEEDELWRGGSAFAVHNELYVVMIDIMILCCNYGN